MPASQYRASALRSFAIPLLAVLACYGTNADAQPFGVHGYIYPQAQDIGTSADIFVVARAGSTWFMRDGNGAFVRWSNRFADLVPAYAGLALGDIVPVPVHASQFPLPGTYEVYFGYMRCDGNGMIYIDEVAALELTVLVERSL